LRCELVDNKNDVAVIRCNLNTEDDADVFFAIFKEKSATNWIVWGQLTFWVFRLYLKNGASEENFL